MPVGRIHYLHMGPLNFREFVEAIDPSKIEYLNKTSPDHNIPDAAHAALCSLQRDFLFTGGMPEAVATIHSKKRSEACSSVGFEPSVKTGYYAVS